MAHFVETRASSPVNDLRDALAVTERALVQPTASTVESTLLLLDRIQQIFDELQRENGDLRAEEGRWLDLCRGLEAQPRSLVRAAVSAGGLAALRAKHPPATGFWWTLDEAYARRQRQAILRTVSTLLAIVVVVVGGLWLFQRLFPPNPTAVLVFDTSRQLEELIAEKKWPEALVIVERSLQQAPDEPELLVWQVVLAERNNDAQFAVQQFQQLEVRFADRLPELWNLLANRRMVAGDLDGAIAAAEGVLQINPQDPQAYLWLATAAEQRGDISKAIGLLETAANYAGRDNPQLYVTARMRMGQLMQQGVMPPGTATPAPEAPQTPSP